MAGKGGRYDYGHRDPSKLKSFKIRSYDFQSRSDADVRRTSGYGDNAMSDPSSTNESAGNSIIDQIHQRLNAAKMTDDLIRQGATLTERGFQKLAAQLNVSAAEIKGLMDTLRKRIVNGGPEMILGEDRGPRYSWESDAMGSVTIRDSHTGNEKFFSGSRGFSILQSVDGLIAGSPDEQAFLATYCEDDKTPVNEDQQHSPDFIEEIAASVSTFNFPWKLGDRFGTGTAQFSGDDEGSFSVTVVNVRDQNGEEIEDERLSDQLRDQAIKFIPEA